MNEQQQQQLVDMIDDLDGIISTLANEDYELHSKLSGAREDLVDAWKQQAWIQKRAKGSV